VTDGQSKAGLFKSRRVRAEWDAENEKWWFSILDIIAILTDQPDYKKVRNYWKWLKNKLIAEGSQLVGATNQLKLRATDGKLYKTAIARVAERVRQGGHDIPQDVIRCRFAAGLCNFRAHYRQAVDDWALYDNAGTEPAMLEWGENQ
jgi:hypothetical protein